jgi:hypothetical protein
LSEWLPLWRAPRIHGELKMLGIAERTVSRILRGLRPPSQTWKTFLHNHLNQSESIDFFTVPRIPRKVLFVFIVLEHRRRQVLHFNMREHPTAAWTSQTTVEAFLDRDAPRHTRDRDSIYDDDVPLRISAMGMEELLTAPRSPLAKTLRRTLDRLDKKRLLERFRHPEREASEASPGFVLRLLPWFPDLFGARQAMSIPSAGSIGRIIAMPQLGGLHHRYERVAA